MYRSFQSSLRQMKKGARVEHTYEVARLCRENGVIPEFSFVLGGPEDPAGETEKTLDFIKRPEDKTIDTPMAFLAEGSAHRVLRTHFHAVDQFQNIFIRARTFV